MKLHDWILFVARNCRPGSRTRILGVVFAVALGVYGLGVQALSFAAERPAEPSGWASPQSAFLQPVLPQAALSQSVSPQPELPQMDYDQMLKPLVDTSRQPVNPTGRQGASSTTLYGQTEKHGQISRQTPPQSSPSAQKPLVLTGKIQTLQQAIEAESRTVDWYGWYLSVRRYLESTGGLQCKLGTPIKFYKNGRIEALSNEVMCLQSVADRMYPLPPGSKLDAVILPVRQATAPPASRDELYSRIKHFD